MKKLWGRILCALGWHLWTWERYGDKKYAYRSPPPYAKCERCGERYEDSDFEGYPS